jgi:DNA-binding NarL/FixJ family response regulator
MEKTDTQILIADNQFLITESLSNFIRYKMGFKVRALVSNKTELIKALSDTSFSMIIIDFNQIEIESVSEMQKLLEHAAGVPVLILTNSLTKNELHQLNSIGIKHIIFKSVLPEELKNAIESTLKGKKYYCQEVLDMFMEAYEDKNALQDNVSLTNAEIEIVRQIAEGKTTKEIATNKHISFHTVMTHRKNIFRKLKVNNASELVMFAIRSGIIDTIEYHI